MKMGMCFIQNFNCPKVSMNISLLQEEEEELDDVDAMKEKDEIDDDDDDDVIAPPLRAISRHSSTSSLVGRTHTHTHAQGV